MIQQNIYEKLKQLCDDYYTLQAEAQKVVDGFNNSHSGDERNSLREKLKEVNEKAKACADEFSKIIRDTLTDLCRDNDDPVVENLKHKVLSPFDTCADNSRYNRINRLMELDKYVEFTK